LKRETCSASVFVIYKTLLLLHSENYLGIQQFVRGSLANQRRLSTCTLTLVNTCALRCGVY